MRMKPIAAELLPCGIEDALAAPRGIGIAALLSTVIWLGFALTVWTLR